MSNSALQYHTEIEVPLNQLFARIKNFIKSPRDNQIGWGKIGPREMRGHDPYPVPFI